MEITVSQLATGKRHTPLNVAVNVLNFVWFLVGFISCPCGESNHTSQVIASEQMQWYLKNHLNFCRHGLHLIVDEIFGLTVHDEDAEFRSILSIPKALDNERVHMVWGISKVRDTVYPTKYALCSCALFGFGYVRS